MRRPWLALGCCARGKNINVTRPVILTPTAVSPSEKPIDPQLFKNKTRLFMDPKIVLPCWEKPITGVCLQPDKSSPFPWCPFPIKSTLILFLHVLLSLQTRRFASGTFNKNFCLSFRSFPLFLKVLIQPRDSTRFDHPNNIRWPRGPIRGFYAASLLESRVRISPRAWISVSWFCCALCR
jgi:hypothetical protein